MSAPIHDDTRNMLNMQHITQIQKDGIIQTSPVAAIKRLKWHAHIVEGGHHLRKAPNPNPFVYNESLNWISLLMYFASILFYSIFLPYGFF